MQREIWKNENLFLSIYHPEFVLELIFLKGMCTGRACSYNQTIIKNEILLCKYAMEYANALANKELELRLREEKMILQSYLSDQSNEQQKDLYNEYFAICKCYKDYMRKSNSITFNKWEICYTSLLLKINIISGVSDKLHILNEGYSIIERNKTLIPNKYLKAACNYAGDLMWRNKIDESYQVLDNAVQFILDRNWTEKWGVIYQMYIFSRLYKSCPDSPSDLFEEYDNLWSNKNISIKMHEPMICASNYAILLMSVGKTNEARELLKNSLEDCVQNNAGIYNQYLLQTNLAAVEYLSGNCEEAISLETACENLIAGKLVPIFSHPFLQKRHGLMVNIYSNKTPVDNVLKPLLESQVLSTGYYSDNYTRLLLFSDINYWSD